MSESSQMKMSREAREFFLRLNNRSKTGTINTLMDQYFLCAILGITANREELFKSETFDLKRSFAGRVKKNRSSLYASLFYRHGTQYQLKGDDPQLMKEFNKFFSEETETKLSKTAIVFLNKYSEGGFQIIKKELEDSSDLAQFMVEYVRLLVKYDNEVNSR